jgi:hypothetical protein
VPASDIYGVLPLLVPFMAGCTVVSQRCGIGLVRFLLQAPGVTPDQRNTDDYGHGCRSASKPSD